MQWVGRISYSLYLWNSLFLSTLDNPQPLPLGQLQEFPFNVPPVFVCAALSYYLVERPMIRLGHTVAARVGEDRRNPLIAMPEVSKREAA